MRARRLVRRLGCLLAGTALASGTLLGTAATGANAATAWTGSSFAYRVLYDMNVARAHYGLPALRPTYGLTYISGPWSSHMARTHLLAHNPYLVSQANVHCLHWSTLGENVGYGYSQNPDALFRAYWNSAPHRANILDRSYRYVGITAVFSGVSAWNTVDFANAC